MSRQSIAGRFQIEGQVGHGGAGTVYRALDLHTGDRVAVKLLRSAEDEDGARFAREAQLLSQLQHPGLVRYIAHGTSDGDEPYLVMEWLDGEDLRARLARSDLEREDSVTIARCVAEALAEVHRAGLVHRDIKPGNIFLCGGSAAQVKLIDFGLARVRTAKAELTLTGVAIGTPSYMAPEQARGDREVDARADLFSLGCVLYKCLTGRAPFEGSSAFEVMTKVLLDEPTPVPSIAPAVPAELARLVAALLEKDPARRPRSAADVAARLASLEAHADDDGPQSMALPQGITAGERRVMSVLLVAEGAPDAARAEALDALVQEHGGRLAELAGGARVVTLEGSAAPVDQAASAALCALAVRAALPGAPMALATGISEVAGRLPTGRVIERAVAMLARGVEAAAAAARDHRPPPSWIAIDEETARLVEARFEVKPTDAGLGLGRPLEVGLASRTLLGKPTTIVGRSFEISAIGQLFHECVEARQASAVVITGPAGMGKSRLAHELLRGFREIAPDVEVWIGRGEPSRAKSALGLLGQVLRHAMKIREGEPLEAQRLAISRRVAGHARPEEAARRAEFLAELAGVEVPADRASPALRAARADPLILGEQMARAWEAFLDAECATRPVVIVLEDLHWGDPSSVRVIDAALGAIEPRPWMVLALARPELATLYPTLWQQRQVQVFRLAALSRKASVALARQVLGDADEATCERLAAQAGGNAFYLEELIRSVAQGEASGEGPLPETVLAMVQSRLAGLEVEARRVLRAASVFGAAFWAGGVSALLGGTPGSWSLEPWIDALVAQEILVRRPSSRIEGEVEHAFRHTLLREGAYTMLTEDDRALGHRLAGEWLERRGEREPAVLAEHFERGGVADRAGAYCARAAQQALWGSDTDAAMAWARRGLELGVPEAVRASLLALLCEAHSWRDDWTAAAGYGDAAIACSAPGSAPWAAGIRAKLGEAFRRMDTSAFLPLVHALERVDPAPDAAASVLLGLSTATFILDWSCRFADAAECIASMTLMVARSAPDNPIAHGWLRMGKSLRSVLATGDPWDGLAHGEAALARFTEANHSRGVLLARFAIGGNAWALGDLARAERELTATLVVNEEFALGSSLRAIFLAGVLCDRGAFDEATRALEDLVERSRARGAAHYEGQASLALAGVLLTRGDAAAADVAARAALALPGLMPVDRLRGMSLAAGAHLALGRPEEALAAATAARVEHRRHGGLGPRQAVAQLVYAQALLAVGDGRGAHRAITSARDHLLARAAKIADPALRASFLERVPENARTLALAAKELG